MVLNFILSGEILYWRTPDLGSLRCVDAVEYAKLIEQIHVGVCGTHMNGITLARKILRAGYLLMTMENYYCKFVQKCHKFQVHGDLMRVPPHELSAMNSPWPFVAWVMDVISPIEPATLNGHKLILVAIDYYTKWLEEVSHKLVTKKVLADFVQNNLIYKFGVPESIITDNSMNLKIHFVRDIYSEEDADNHRGWQEMLPYALLGYRTNVRKSTEATPYFLVYGTEAAIPAKVEIPSLRIIQEAELSNVEWVSKRIDQLTLIDEKRVVAVRHGQLYRQRMIRIFHKRVRAIIFEVGKLVLKRIFPHQDEHKGNFAPNWQGSYMVRKALSIGDFFLSEMDGIAWPKPINLDAVKRYYV
ncbi:uncharacterized protein [Solanum lycopersicum]|uniref:uncharacterized protein n=1 Tax=Solanum lycopersicum TaxID=4081 RepID=UPI003749CDF5